MNSSSHLTCEGQHGLATLPFTGFIAAGLSTSAKILQKVDASGQPEALQTASKTVIADTLRFQARTVYFLEPYRSKGFKK